MSGTISILGAGKLCAVMARLAITTGHRVLIAGSGDPERIRPIMEALAPGAEPVTALQAARNRELIVLALPVGKYRSLPWKASAGKLLIDSTKYRWEVDRSGPDRIRTTPPAPRHRNSWPTPSSSWPSTAWATTTWTKDPAHPDPRPEGHGRRRKQASQHPRVITLVDRLSFDPVPAGTLQDAQVLQPHADAFGTNVPATDLQTLQVLEPNTASALATSPYR
ncbi:MAG TPA: NAD(P)-binding domain-containing protein [Micrococcaceae bacterium]|nr:NAD(P)-binding domain-containing protein [Micrococcaceae bacterium]